MARPRRLLTVLAAALLFVVLIAGCGGSSVPSNAVAVVDGAPITKASFNHWMQIAENSLQTTAIGGHPPVPVPPNFTACIAYHKTSDPQPAKGQPAPTQAALKTECQQAYQSGLSQTMPFLITADWLQGEAAEQSIKITDAKVAAQLKQIEGQQFPTPTALAQFLQASGETNADLLFRVRVDALSNQIRMKITNSAPKATPAAIAAYYNAHKSTFGKPETRDLRVILVSTPAVASRVLALLKAGVSFTHLARQFTIDTTTKKSGGALIGQTQAGLEVNLGTAVFAAPLHKAEGPVKTTLGYEIFMVGKITPGTQQPLAQATASITQTLTQTNQSKTLNAFVKTFNAKWISRTVCATGYIVADCKNAPKKSTTTTTPTTPPPTQTTSTSQTTPAPTSTTTAPTTTTTAPTTTTTAPATPTTTTTPAKPRPTTTTAPTQTTTTSSGSGATGP